MIDFDPESIVVPKVPKEDHSFGGEVPRVFVMYLGLVVFAFTCPVWLVVGGGVVSNLTSRASDMKLVPVPDSKSLPTKAAPSYEDLVYDGRRANPVIECRDGGC